MSITSVTGFAAAGLAAGIKPSGNKDMALVVNNGPEYNAAAVFTRNKIVASPVKFSRTSLADGTIKAVLYNAGNANACNGTQGDKDAFTCAELVAEELGVQTTDVAVCSTGLIGEQLPMDRLRDGISRLPQELGTTEEAGRLAAEAIMTTDTVRKEALICGGQFTVGAMGKGVGMMAPSLATMLVLLVTDAQATHAQLDEALRAATSVTFDTLDIDGSTSTNDTVIVMANGASGYAPSQSELNEAVLKACASIADQLQGDAEGVTKRVRVAVTGAITDEEALEAARTLARDNLFKCAMFGSDPNWGRVLAAIGMAKAELDPDHIGVWFNDQPVCLDSTGAPGARDADLSGMDIDVRVDLGTGGQGASFVRTTDLSHDYVDINSAYSS